jgi:hypothetical protein
MRRLPVILGLVLLGAMISSAAAMTVIATQGMTGHEGLGFLLLGYGGGWFLLFGVGAALPVLVSRAWRRSLQVAFAFGIGGSLSGILEVFWLFGGSPLVVRIAFAMAFTLPWILGAILLKAVDARGRS